MSALVDRLARVFLPAELSPLAHLPLRQARWVLAQSAVTAGLWASGLWSSHPELSLSLALSIGPVAASPRRIWALPLVSAAVVLAGLGTAAVGVSSLIGAGAIAGLAACLLLPDRRDALDLINGTLATLAGTALGLFAAVNLTASVSGTAVGAVLLSALVGLVASQGLVPVVLRTEAMGLPSRAQIRRTLKPPYRPPALRGLDLYDRARPHTPDRRTRLGLAEVATWVYTLQLTLQSHDEALDTIDVDDVQRRIDACNTDDDGDAFTKDRQLATAKHLQRLLEHREALTQERRRTLSLVDYALAFMEEV
ncbi:MAG: hypothetical protein AB8H79_18950, partial [Myxococcota bacterium]